MRYAAPVLTPPKSHGTSSIVPALAKNARTGHPPVPAQTVEKQAFRLKISSSLDSLNIRWFVAVGLSGFLAVTPNVEDSSVDFA